MQASFCIYRSAWLFAAVSTTSFMVAEPISGLSFNALLTEENETPHFLAMSFNVIVAMRICIARIEDGVRRQRKNFRFLTV